MFEINVSSLKIGQTYSRAELAKLWKYDGTKGLERGIVTPRDSNIVILFTTKEKEKDVTQYVDHYEDGQLIIDGQESHMTDKAILNPLAKFYSFYREKKKLNGKSVPFTYQGEVKLIKEKSIIRSKGQAPSKFHFRLADSKANNVKDKIDEEIVAALAYGMINMSEGAQRIVNHIIYERSSKVRAEALKFHPHRCEVCGFDFDEFYGRDFAEGYIEIHHIEPVSVAGVREVNPLTDLVPVCANCHRMLHHKRNTLTVEELKKKIKTKI